MTRNIRLQVVFAVAIYLAGAMAFAQSSGYATYIPNCAGCHGTNGIVASEYMKSRGTPDATDPYIKGLTAKQMFNSVKNGREGSINGMYAMRPFKNKLTDEQIREAVAFYRELGNAAPIAPVQVAQDAAPVSEPAPLAEEKSIDSGARSGAVSHQAKPVLDRAIQFFGGIDNIRALRNDEGRVQTTQISQGNVVQIQSHWISVYPNIQWQEYQASVGQKSMSGVSFFDGTIGWHIRNGKLTDMDEVQKKGASRSMFTQPKNLLALSGGRTVNYEGKSGADDVLLFRQGELSCRLHIDSMGQVAKYAYRDKTDEIDVMFSDYRDVGGVKMAYRTSMTKNGQTWIDSQVIQAEANTNPSLEKLAQKPGGPPLDAAYLASIAPLPLPSFFVSIQSHDDHLQLNPDYSFQLQEGGQPYHGTFAIRGNTLLLDINESNIQTSLTRQGHDLTDSSGQTWSHREQSAGTVPSGAVLRNDDIIKLAKVGVDDATISAKIKSSKCQFDTSTDALVLLKKSGVSSAVLKAMVGAGR